MRNSVLQVVSSGGRRGLTKSVCRVIGPTILLTDPYRNKIGLYIIVTGHLIQGLSSFNKGTDSLKPGPKSGVLSLCNPLSSGIFLTPFHQEDCRRNFVCLRNVAQRWIFKFDKEWGETGRPWYCSKGAEKLRRMNLFDRATSEARGLGFELVTHVL